MFKYIIDHQTKQLIIEWAILTTSITVDAVVPTPGIVETSPLVIFKPADTKSPHAASLTANNDEKANPNNGIFLKNIFGVYPSITVMTY